MLYSNKECTVLKKSVLIVDDVEAIAKILKIYLADLCECVCFNNPIKAIAWLQEGNKPDLIISDINMPNMTGLEFLDYIRQSDIFKTTPFVILSAESSSTEIDELLKRGAADYILKPFNPKELKAKFESLFSD
jgi:CheY-like chemotaxis protein